jgi:hypothetical protein
MLAKTDSNEGVMQRRKLKAAAMALSAFLANGAEANDTNAVIAAGGITFARTDAIRMEEEDLFISPGEVRVAYQFSNLTDRDETLTIAFPIPDIDVGLMSEAPHEFHASSHDGDILNFRLMVNGAPVAAAFEARAIAENGQDITKLLAAHGVPLVGNREDIDEVWDATTKLSPDAVKKLEAAGALMDDDEHHPTWVVKAAYTWRQTFPARQTVKIEHVYQPVLGSTYLQGVLEEGSFDDEYCADKEFARAVNKLPRHKDFNTVWKAWLGYILKTGANWAGPIGHFHLELAKGKADLLSLCPIPGLTLHKKDRSFVADARAFTPQSDLKILYVFGGCEHLPCSR